MLARILVNKTGGSEQVAFLMLWGKFCFKKLLKNDNETTTKFRKPNLYFGLQNLLLVIVFDKKDVIECENIMTVLSNK